MSEPQNVELALAMSQIKTLVGDMSDIKTSIRELAAAYTRLAVVEERQTSSSQAVDRAFQEIEKLNARIREIEASQPQQKQTSAMVNRVAALVLAAVIGAVLTGVIRSPRDVGAQLGITSSK